MYICGLEVQTEPKVCHVGEQCDLLYPPVTPTISDSMCSPGPVTCISTKGNISGVFSQVDISYIKDLESTTVDVTESLSLL